MTDTNQEVPKYTIFISTTYKKEYKKISNQEAIILQRIGSHSELFGKNKK